MNDPQLLEQQLSTIPPCDQQKLERFFHRMMTGDYFASTLFGNKPLTFQEFHEDPWKMSSYWMICPYHNYLMDEGWETWTKHKSLFLSSKFIFSKIPTKSDYEFIILINKVAFKKMFEENRDVFEQALGPQITVEQILNDFEEGKKTFDQILNEHVGLWGLVLGYGRGGSLLVFKDSALRLQIIKRSLYPLAPRCEHEKIASKGMQNAIKFSELNYSRQGVQWHRLTYFQMEDVEDPYDELNKSKNLSEIFCPSWEEQIVDILPPNFYSIKGSEELANLRKEYGEAMQIARETFKTKSFLVGFLEQYCKQE